jgi:hypothetical protein
MIAEDINHRSWTIPGYLALHLVSIHLYRVTNLVSNQLIRFEPQCKQAMPISFTQKKESHVNVQMERRDISPPG